MTPYGRRGRIRNGRLYTFIERCDGRPGALSPEVVSKGRVRANETREIREQLEPGTE